MSESATIDPNTVVSVESPSGRVLEGVGVAPEALEETISAREPAEPAAEEPSSPGTPSSSPPAAGPARDDATGQFKKGHRADKRIHQLTAQREEAERRNAAAEQRAQELERRLAALEAQRSTRTEPTPAPTPTPSPAPPPEPDFDKEYEAFVGTEKYPTYGAAIQAYNREYAKWYQTNQLDAHIRRSIEADRASRAQQDHVQSFASRGRAAYSDFDAVLSSATVVLGDTPEEGEAKLKVVLGHPEAEHLVYAISKSPQLQTELKNIKNHLQLGYFLGRIPRTAVAAPAPTAPAVASHAPAPYQPVGTGSKTSAPTLEDAADSGDYEQYRRIRAAQRKDRR